MTRFVGIGIVALLLMNPVPARAQAVSDSGEIQLGAMLARQFDRERGLENPTVQDRRMEAYLQGIADSLAPYTRRKLPWHIHYDSHPGFRSGFALPGGHIVIGVWTPKAPAPKAITDRIAQIRKEIATEHWEKLTKTRPIALPYSND